MENKNKTYLILTIILLILSAIGGYFLFQIYQQSQNTTNLTSSSTPKIELIPTDIPQNTTPTITATPSGTKIKVTPTASPTAKISPSPKVTPTTVITPTPVAQSSSTLNFSSTADGFSIVYNNTRKFYQDKEVSGDRFTFTNPAGNFAIHVGLNGNWAWTNPSRTFTSDFLVAGQPTFKYDIPTQTIVDLQYNSKNYTIQCVHNGKDSLKAECDQFLKDFKLL
jgi:hypothetical protein